MSAPRPISIEELSYYAENMWNVYELSLCDTLYEFGYFSIEGLIDEEKIFENGGISQKNLDHSNIKSGDYTYYRYEFYHLRDNIFLRFMERYSPDLDFFTTFGISVLYADSYSEAMKLPLIEHY